MTRILYADGSRGVFTPQYFAQSINRDFLRGASDEDMKTLLAGPDEEDYWKAWVSILDNATVEYEGETLYLHQDIDLWLMSKDELELLYDEVFG